MPSAGFMSMNTDFTVNHPEPFNQNTRRPANQAPGDFLSGGFKIDFLLDLERTEMGLPAGG